MKISQTFKNLVLPLVLLIPGVLNAAIIGDKLDLQKLAGDTGATYTPGVSFIADASASSLITSGGSVDIPDETFTLTADTFEGQILHNGVLKDTYSGTFTVDGGLLGGTFSQLIITDLFISLAFEADLNYTGGSLAAGLQGGRIEGVTNAFSFVAKIGPITAVPVPAAAWLFGTGLVGLAGVARRRA